MSSGPAPISITINSRDLAGYLSAAERSNINLDTLGGTVSTADLLEFLVHFDTAPGYRDITINLDSTDVTVNYEDENQ